MQGVALVSLSFLTKMGREKEVKNFPHRMRHMWKTMLPHRVTVSFAQSRKALIGQKLLYRKKLENFL